ncbi:hypothetical protein I5907_19390 [Panacibacter sp. DH6]|uniref:DUF6438 domain-containing protein n=1 Tax=Panacibacter microcysteis TaxID=2793269 RepID=A0A931MD08_9BACT|nr:DUF6438 domain-containing protein [Panacibacter microcysteis]MBG9378411.1 hypothetical protein [Panacibacter microcysteis]
MKIIFHSSRCNGDCPKLDLEIDSSKNLFVSRQYFKHKDEIKTPYSGQFQGTLIETDYNKLIGLLQNCNLDTLKFPDITCCDAVITTIIVYYNGQRKYLKSMTPPNEANDLIEFLTLLGDNKKLQRTNETKNIEY